MQLFRPVCESFFLSSLGAPRGQGPGGAHAPPSGARCGFSHARRNPTVPRRLPHAPRPAQSQPPGFLGGPTQGLTGQRGALGRKTRAASQVSEERAGEGRGGLPWNGRPLMAPAPEAACRSTGQRIAMKNSSAPVCPRPRSARHVASAAARGQCGRGRGGEAEPGALGTAGGLARSMHLPPARERSAR